MANMTRYDPFSLDNVFDDFFKGFVVRPMRGEVAPKIADIKIDVSENDKGYTVKADIPGVKKEDIQVSIDGNMVSISAEVKRESEQKEGDKVIHSERYFGRTSRSFSLGNELDEATSEAKYTDGVLELILAKKTAASTKKLTVQ